MYRIKAKRTILYYQDSNDTIKKHYIYRERKVTINQAKEYLEEKGIEYNSIISTLIENIELEIPIKEVEKYIVNKNNGGNDNE